MLLPEDVPLAAGPTVRLADLAGETLYAGAGNPQTAEWTDLAERLFAGRGIAVAEPFPEIEGSRELVCVVRKRGVGAGERGVHRRAGHGAAAPGGPRTAVAGGDGVAAGPAPSGPGCVGALARELADEDGWLAAPAESWLPPEDARAMGVARP